MKTIQRLANDLDDEGLYMEIVAGPPGGGDTWVVFVYCTLDKSSGPRIGRDRDLGKAIDLAILNWKHPEE